LRGNYSESCFCAEKGTYNSPGSDYRCAQRIECLFRSLEEAGSAFDGEACTKSSAVSKTSSSSSQTSKNPSKGIIERVVVNERRLYASCCTVCEE